MRIWLIILLFAALFVEVWAIFLIDHTVVVEASARTNLIQQFETGTLPIGDQLAARARAMAAEYATPKGPSNPDLGDRVVRGRVVGLGKAAVGADVTLDPRAVTDGVNPDGYAGQPHWYATANERGFFEFADLPKGEFVLRAWSDDGVAFAQASLNDNDFVCERTLKLVPSAPINGIVRDASGSPIAHALVFPFPAESKTAPQDSHLMAFLPAATDGEGRFGFAHAPGSCKFLINAPGHGLWLTNAVSAGTQDVVFEPVAPGGTSGLVVREEDGRPAANLVVRVDALTYPLMSRRVKTDVNGRFSIGELPVGAYRIVPDTDRLLVSSPAPEVHVGAGGVSEAPRMTVRRARTARGRIVDNNGTGLSGLTVVARSDTGITTARSDQAGYYLLFGLEQGEYTVGVRGAGGFSVESGGSNTLNVTDSVDNAAPNFVVRDGAGKGQLECIVRDATGQPAEGAALYYCAEPLDENGGPLERESGAVLTDAQGRFTWDGVPRDWRFWVYASHKGYISKPYGWTTLENSASHSIELTLDTQSDGNISGSVVDALERPAAGLAVVARLTDERPGWPAHIAALTAQDGSFQLAGCPEGAYVVTVGKLIDGEGRIEESLREAPVAVGASGDVNGLRIVLP